MGGISGNTETPGDTKHWIRTHYHIAALCENHNKWVNKKVKTRNVEFIADRMQCDEQEAADNKSLLELQLPTLWEKNPPNYRFYHKRDSNERYGFRHLKEQSEDYRRLSLDRFTKHNVKEYYHNSIKRQELMLFSWT